MLPILKRTLENGGLLALGLPSVRRLALEASQRGCRDLILLYHRVRPQVNRELSLVPTLPENAFRRQLEIIAGMGRVVSLPEILTSRRESEPIRFAITFDDDAACHVTYALPLLESLNLSATFFLSGRALHGLGHYWWEHLEAAIEEHGIDEVCRILDVPLQSPHGLAAMCETSMDPDEFVARVPISKEPVTLAAQGIRVLGEAGMEIGFHTVRHPVLPQLTTEHLNRALNDGRGELGDLSGTPIRFFAYPYGKTNGMVSEHTRAAGYQAAFTNLGYPIRSDSDRFQLGRWDVRTDDPDRFVKSALLRLLRPGNAETE